MELAEAIRQLVPLQMRMPDPKHPLTLRTHCVAEVFLVGTSHGQAVVWLDPFWCRPDAGASSHIAYAMPRFDPERARWIDQDPRYGPHCHAYQKPVVFERLEGGSGPWREHQAWQMWRARLGAA
ncbi:hypothetical protein F2Q65_03005 [Thiohalocapsa marina]|uniref:Uncharacterized protein n=1 Tax=Thiohalocapsa marina TaxID=424902 RepID=A0A5M8FT33_9GAMM|nr:hypothetical protein [Thiohalocapsa marina]KAA6186882.1 hypothetical protein F2Q65_03005 [Thiohalocapsa marina]